MTDHDTLARHQIDNSTLHVSIAQLRLFYTGRVCDRSAGATFYCCYAMRKALQPLAAPGPNRSLNTQGRLLGGFDMETVQLMIVSVFDIFVSCTTKKVAC